MTQLPSASLPDTGPEVPLPIEDLIYTRTDDRGVIRAANKVFQRLTGRDWPNLIGAPHRFIRHPDMPRGFFHLFWKQLRNGDPAVGYIKNRGRDGGHYWVLASAVPCQDCYFSIRFRPTSPFFDRIPGLYARLTQQERQENLSSEAAGERFLAALCDLGFDDYTQFMCHATEQETLARNRALGRPDDVEVGRIAAVVDLLQDALRLQSGLITRFRDLMLLPVNMRLVAARLEPQGGPISQISMNYKSASDEIAARLATFVSGDHNLCRRMAAAARSSLVLLRCAQLQAELLQRYDRATPYTAGVDRRVELQMMAAAESLCRTRTEQALQAAVQLAVSLSEASADVRRMILGLDTIRILGRVESRRDLAVETSMSATLDRIDRVQGEISDSLKRLTDLAATIHSGLSALRPHSDRNAVAAAR